MKNQFEIVSQARHLRYIFFIDEKYPCGSLKELIFRNLGIWGGQFNPIVPICSNKITPEWEKLISYFDPDFIYYSKNVSKKFVFDLCLRMNLNPIDIIELDSPKSVLLNGINSHYLLDAFDSQTILIDSVRYDECPSPKSDFYSLNFFIKDCLLFEMQLTSRFNKLTVNKANFGDFTKNIIEQSPFFKSLLSRINVNSILLRCENRETDNFEIIVTDDVDSFHDMIYFWNKNLYEHSGYQPRLNHILISLAQMKSLLNDPWFFELLKRLNYGNNKVEVVSFSLDKKQLEETVSALQYKTKQINFKIKEVEKFPYKILNPLNIGFTRSQERLDVQTIYSPSHIANKWPGFINNTQSRSGMLTWAVDYSIYKDNPFGNKQVIFPMTFNCSTVFNKLSRTNTNKGISVMCNSHEQLNSVLRVEIPSFEDVIISMILEPRLLNQKVKPKFRRIKYNDDSRRLAQFFSLFDNNFGFAYEIVFDKFWNELFFELSTNVRVEGDVLSYREIRDRCLEIMAAEGISLNESTPFSLTNLEKSLRYTLQDFCERKLFFIGYIIKCSKCSSKTWYSLEEISNVVTCKGCFHQNSFQAETYFSYKLNSLIKNNFATRDSKGKIQPSGNLTVVKTLLFLEKEVKKISFEYLPQLSVYSKSNAVKADGDIDIVCLIDGWLCIGESKHDSLAFHSDGHDSLNKLIEVAKVITPTFIVLSCTMDSKKKRKSNLEKAHDYVKDKISDLGIKSRIITHVTDKPEYDFNSPYYFFD